MKLIKANLNYKKQGWVTTCSTCGSELHFTMKDTHLHIYGDDRQKEYFIQCPWCGDWIKANVEPTKYDPLTKKYLLNYNY